MNFVALCQYKLYIKVMKLFNTMTRGKQEFIPIDNKTAKIYSCGPTVYSTPHIGNFRAYVFTDILIKTIEFAGYNVFNVMNTTDVGHLVEEFDEEGKNKIEQSAIKEKTTPDAIAKKYTEEFWHGADKLNIRRPKIFAPATNYIDQMIEFVKKLEQLGLTYVTSDGVYFDSSKFPKYNELSKMPIDKLKGGARIDLGEKRNAHDFVLWKFVDPNSMQKWTSPWGKHGCPGWHIECSAIARHHLGDDTFDIHTGGIDHITIHHPNEIAQTQSITKKPMSKFWIHNEHVTVDSKKMSKSLGNIHTIPDIIARGFDPLAFRYYCLLTHYRQMLNFTWEGLKSASAAYDNMVKKLVIHANSDKLSTPNTDAISAALLDDLNTPKAIGHIWDLLNQSPSRGIYDAVIKFDDVLSLNLQARVESAEKAHPIPSDILHLAQLRDIAKKDRDFKTADNIRDQIISQGYQIQDTKDGTVVIKTT